jgi:Spy/CpxP family protein refolding chaperone
MSLIRMAIAGVAFLGVASVATAQAPQSAEAPRQQGTAKGEKGQRDARMTKRLFTGIELTAAQQEQVQTISAKYAAEKQALRPADGERQKGSDDATRAKMMDLTARSQAEYRAILTPEQQVIFDKNAASIKERLEARAKSEGK